MKRFPRIAAGAGAFLSLAFPAATLAQDASAMLRVSGQVGEQADGYLGLVGSPPAMVRAQMDAVNFKRRAYYTDLAAKRGAKVTEVAAITGCELLRTKVGFGQYYRLPDGVWRKRDAEPIQLPAYCG